MLTLEAMAACPFRQRGELRSVFVGNARNIAFWVVLFLLVLALFNLFENGTSNFAATTVPYSDFIARADKGEVTSVTLDGEQIRVVAKDGMNPAGSAVLSCEPAKKSAGPFPAMMILAVPPDRKSVV